VFEFLQLPQAGERGLDDLGLLPVSPQSGDQAVRSRESAFEYVADRFSSAIGAL
jgi:hypothetical protein